MRYGMVINLEKCIGCHTCTIACKVANGTRPGIFWNLVLDQESGKYPTVSRQFIPRLCMHCKNAPCVDVCPTKATYRTETGIVRIDYDKCAGCRYCMQVCPYGARYFSKDDTGYFKTGLSPNEKLSYQQRRLGIVEKCDLCANRVAQGQEPVCVTACPLKSRTFGDLDDPNSEVSQLTRSKHGFQLHQELGTDPSVYYISP